jgi:methyl-accepting chemotaxis protein
MSESKPPIEDSRDAETFVVRGRDSIQRQIVRGFFGTTSLALLLTASAVFFAGLLVFQQKTDRDLTALAGVIGGASEASLLFDDEKSATEILNALKSRPSIVAAVIYDAQGEIFARYVRSDVESFRPPLVFHDKPLWSWNSIDLATPIEMDGEKIGSIFIRSNTDDLKGFFFDSILLVLVVLLFSLILCGWGAARLRRRIADPLALLVEGSASMAQGDLLTLVEYESEDEIGAVARAFNGMVGSLRGLVAQVRENTNYVAEAGNELALASVAMADEAAVQQEAVEASGESVDRIISSMHNVNESVESLSETALETSSAAIEMNASIAETGNHIDQLSTVIETAASSVVEMTGAIREIARSADALNRSTESTSAALELMSGSVRQVESYALESHQLSADTSSKASQGMSAVHETVEGMREIQVSFKGMESIINNLSEKSESIGAVVKVIQGVVEQTNLLALNAAIISAQAGEHGRAFSVVAEEVRNLAERTSHSTTEITQLIESVQLGIDSAVTAMGQGATRVDRGVDLSNEAGRMLREIGESAEQSARRAKEIVEATRSQAADIDQVGVAMNHVKSIAVQLGRGTHEQDNASAEITKGVEQMRHLGYEVKRAAQHQRRESGLITESVEIVASRIREISVETKDQSKGADQIREALQVFREITLRSASRAEQTKATVSELNDHAQGLEEEVGRFRT